MTVATSVSTAGPSGYDPPPLFVSVRSEDPSAPLLDVSVRREDGSAWAIEVRGELDLCTGPMLKRHLESYNDPSGNNGHPRKVIYLLPELGFMDARGLHYLLTAVDGSGPETITIREPSTRVSRLLELVGMESMIEKRANR